MDNFANKQELDSYFIDNFASYITLPYLMSTSYRLQQMGKPPPGTSHTRRLASLGLTFPTIPTNAPTSRQKQHQAPLPRRRPHPDLSTWSNRFPHPFLHHKDLPVDRTKGWYHVYGQDAMYEGDAFMQQRVPGFRVLQRDGRVGFELAPMAALGWLKKVNGVETMAGRNRNPDLARACMAVMNAHSWSPDMFGQNQRLEVLSVVGHGSNGAVVSVSDRDNGMRLPVKIAYKHDSSMGTVCCIPNEVLAMDCLAQVNPSPHLLQCLGQWQDYGHTYFVTELFRFGPSATSNNLPVVIQNWLRPGPQIIPLQLGSSNAFEYIASEIEYLFQNGSDSQRTFVSDMWAKTTSK
ncbi:hypothetical protein HDU98_011192 [Podochytrium sp. JEL0797]|nr:hypothetical protein HDU98_011192 [Podochytrium sp. JEL0797]